MYLKSKQIAFLGLLTAVSVILIVLSGVLEFSTLFFLCLASFCVGIAIVETSLALGAGLFAATLILGFLLAPNKLYCVTYSALSIYILAIEGTISIVEKKVQDWNQRKKIIVPFKFVYFNVIYLPILFLLPKLIYQGTFSTTYYLIAIACGQAAFYVFDRVYFGFTTYYVKVLKNRLKLKG